MAKGEFCLIGLDIGTTGIRAVELRRSRSTADLEIVRMACAELPPGVMSDGAVIDQPALAKAIRALWRQGRFRTRRLAFAVTDPNVLTRQLDLAWMPPDDFKAALRYQVQGSLPFDFDSVALDYHLLAEIERTDTKGQATTDNRVLVVATNREHTAAIASAIRKAGLEPVVADHAPFALIRSVCQGHLPNDASVHAVVDIGADQMTVVIHSEGQPRFIRTLSQLGSNLATRSIASALDIDSDEAEALKRSTGLNGAAPTVVSIAESSVFSTIVDSQAAEIDQRSLVALSELNTWAATIVGEIANSIDYYASGIGVAPVESVLLVGRAANLDGLRERIATQLPYPVQSADATMGLSVNPKLREYAQDAQAALAIGLAMAVKT
ncbi:MAG: type IV pilus assembly protein PilM [Actinomycetota bacterium]|nr:type IV pilus assembly protein PilM [Actinomycetota bacterium]